MYNDDTYELEKNNLDNDDSLGYDFISGLGESDYENEDLFDTEVSNEQKENEDVYKLEDIEDVSQIEIPVDYDFLSNFNKLNAEKDDAETDETNKEGIEENKNEEQNEIMESNIDEDVSSKKENDLEESVVDSELESSEDETVLVNENQVGVDTEFLDDSKFFINSLEENDYEIPIVEPTAITLSDTPIEELNKLTEYEQDKISTTDIKSLFDRVGVNVKEASDIFRKNTEMKEKIDTRFEELKKLQSEVEKAKQTQYDEINSYKEEVLNKLTEKKDEIEKRLNKLKEFQANLEKEREEFEKYKKLEKEEIERVQKEIQDAYDSRREELSHIEDILRKQKDSLDEERSQLSLDRIQYESDKNELANNLLKFNEIVDSFTNGMDKINKE